MFQGFGNSNPPSRLKRGLAPHISFSSYACAALALSIVFGELVLRLGSLSGLQRGVRFGGNVALPSAHYTSQSAALFSSSVSSAVEEDFGGRAAAKERVEAAAAAPAPARGHEEDGAEEGAENPWLSSQVCYENPDETELCVLGPVCVTNSDDIVFLVKQQREYFVRDTRAWCPDHRAYRRTQHGCSHDFQRDMWGEETWRGDPSFAPNEMMGDDPVKFAQNGRPPLLPLKGRRWLAVETMGEAKEVPWEAVMAASDMNEVRQALGPRSLREAEAARGSWVPPPGPEAGMGSIKTPKKVKWLDASVYFANMRGEWHNHIWHWSTAAFPLFDAKRQNRTEFGWPVPKGPFAEKDDSTRSPFTYHVGKVALPPMDYVRMTGRFPRQISAVSDFPSWMQKVWPILTQPQTKLIANGNVAPGGDMEMDDESLTCFKSGVVSSFKPWLFTGLSEAHIFKMHAYTLAGVSTRAYDRYPPRKITILTRSNRGLLNLNEIEELVKETGIPYVINSDMGALTWEEQVKLMSETGILISVHGAQLTNVIYMPANAVVMEVFPYMYRSFLYRDLAQKAGLHYVALNGQWPKSIGDRNRGNYGVYEDPLFKEVCSGPHYSSLDSYSIAECTHRAKYSSPLVDLHQMKIAIADALDDIGCRDSFCHEVKYKHFHIEGTRVTNMKDGTVSVYGDLNQ